MVDGFRRVVRRLAASVTASALACGAAAVAPAASAAETAECQVRPAEQHRDWTGMDFTGDLWCELQPGFVRIQSRSTSPVVGRMLYSPSWFVCWKRGSDYLGSDVWYYTQGDQVLTRPVTKAWGYMPAVAVKAPAPEATGLAKCPWS